ncbi:MAG TPA: hypothetical protein VKT49_05970 [Bryobacteraceae bacterium]|nr:hypothetical protein [Bryobacteraceae bacterium]
MNVARACALLLAFPSLWAQDQRQLILVARRSPLVEILDSANLQTVASIHFDTRIELVTASEDHSTLNIRAYDGHACCSPYTLDTATRKLVKTVSNQRDYFGECLISQDGRWCARLKSFRGPALRMLDTKQGTVRELVPPELPPEDPAGNWSATGAWSGDYFFLYIKRPADGGFLWAIPPDTEKLGPGTSVASFGESGGCIERWPVDKAIVAAGKRIFLYEPFGDKTDRSAGCSEPPPGGAWEVDPANGKLSNEIAPRLHFNAIVSGQSGLSLYGVLPGSPNWQSPVEVVTLRAADGSVEQSRTFGPGVLRIGIGSLATSLIGYVSVEKPH